MANGPHSSNSIEEYLIKTARQAVDEEKWKEITETERYDGSIEWPEFDQVNIDDTFNEDTTEDYINGNFKHLDLIYDSLKSSANNPDRIEGLKHLSSNSGDRPESNTTWWRWKNKYEEADLTRENQLTELGEKILETSDNTNLDLPEIYRELRTTSNSSKGENNGQKLKAFMLYGSGLDTKSVNKRVSLDKEHLKQTRYNLADNHNLMRQDGSLTPNGREMYSIVIEQLKIVGS